MNPQAQEALLNDWLDRYRRLIYRVVMVYADNESSYDDLFQEIALALWRSLPQFEGRAAESTWIYRVALNTGMTYRRKTDRQPDTGTLDENIAAATPTHEADQEMAWVYERIRTLSLIDRSLVLLYLDGNSYEDMASILGISSSNVGAKINRVKRRLAALLADNLAEAS